MRVFECGKGRSNWGAIQTLMLSGVPNYSPARAEYNLNIWISLRLLCTVLLALCLAFRLRMGAQQKQDKAA